MNLVDFFPRFDPTVNTSAQVAEYVIETDAREPDDRFLFLTRIGDQQNGLVHVLNECAYPGANCPSSAMLIERGMKS